MKEQIYTSYDTVGGSSYLTVALPEGMKVIHYRLEMLTSNEIMQLLPVSKRMVDGENRLYFNISSLISLQQILNRRKLKKEELLTIMEGLVHSAKDAEDYQLPLSGYLMDPEYIFVDSATCKPFFVYLPIEEEKESGDTVKQFFQNLILRGQLELTNDNFIQILLNALNQDPFSLKTLEQCLGTGRSAQKSMEQRSRQSGPGAYASPAPNNPVNAMGNRGTVQPVPSVQPLNWNGTLGNPSQEGVSKDGIPAIEPEAKENRKPAMPERPGKPVPPRGKKEEKAVRKSEKKKEKAARKERRPEPVSIEEDGFDAEKAKKKFILPQAVVMIAAAAMVSFGFFTDGETGAIAINNILAAVILIALFEVILYREIYINSRKKKKVSTSAKKDKKSASQVKGNGKKPPVPGQKPEMQKQNYPSAGISMEADEHKSSNPIPAAPVVRQNPVPMPVSFENRTLAAVPSYAASQVETDETELAGTGNSDMPVYLEYYENGVMTRVPLERESTLIGRLKGQVDFAVTNPRVGKMHAEFLLKGGQVFVKDLNSKNGTYINGNVQRIGSNLEYPLNDRDRITLADSEFTLRCSAR